MMDGVAGPVDAESTLKLEEGMRVSWCGMEGTVISVDETVWHGWPVTVKFDCGREILYLRDGRQYEEQTEPCIKVIGKVPVKVKRWQWLIVNKNGKKVVTVSTYTQEEVNSIYHRVIKKIDETEQEYDQ